MGAPAAVAVPGRGGVVCRHHADEVAGDDQRDLARPEPRHREPPQRVEGAVRGVYERETGIATHPALVDRDGDGDREIVVTYRDGRVVALDVAA